MTSIEVRHRITAVLLPVIGLLVGYALSRRMLAIGGLLAGATVILLLIVVAARRIDPHQINLTEKKAYSITLRSTLATSAVTGFVLLVVLVFVGFVLTIVMSAIGYEPLSFTVLQDVLQRLNLLNAFTPITFLILYLFASGMTGVAFWLLYPYIPIERLDVAAPIIFAVTWLYAVLLGLMVVDPGPVFDTPFILALDAALAALWGNLFGKAYRDEQRWGPI